MSFPFSVRQLELSADGSRLFLLYSGRLVIRDVDSGAERTLVTDLAGNEEGFAASLDGRRVSLLCGRQLKMWDASTGSLVRAWTRRGSVCDAGPQMMPDGRLILDPCACGVQLYDIDTGELRMLLRAPWWPWIVKVSPDGRWVEATSDREGDPWLESDEEQTIRWDATTGKRVSSSAEIDALKGFWVSGHGWASASALTPDRSGIVSAFPDGLVGIRAAGDEKVRWLAGHSAGVTAVTVSPDGGAIVSASLDGTVRVCRLKTGAGFGATFRAETPIVKCVLRPDGQTLVAVEETGRVHVLRDLLSAPVQPLWREGPLSPVEWALAPDGSRLFLLYPGWLVVLDVDSGVQRTIVEGLRGSEGALSASVNGHRVSLLCEAELRIWDVETGVLSRAWPAVLEEHARMTPDGRGILDRPGGARRGLALFDVDTGKLKINLSEQTLARPIEVSADGRWVAAETPAGLGERQFAVWDLVTGRLVDFAGCCPEFGQFCGHWFAAMALGANVWDLSTGARVFYRRDYRRPFTALAMMPGDNGMVVGFGDGRLGIWNLSGESKVRRLPGHSAGVRAIAVSPDGQAIVSASSDGVVQVCAARSGSVTAIHRVGGPLCDCVIRPDGHTVVAVEAGRRVHVLGDLLG